MNIWHDIDPKDINSDEFMAVIEIPAGSKKKYELDKRTGLLKLDRILYTSTHYPANYGFIPRTYAEDKDPLDVLVLCSERLDPMIMLKCYPIGVVRMVDCDECDDKIIAIPLKDPTWNFYKDINQLPPHISNEVIHFFEVYKGLENKPTAATEVLGPDGAMEIIAETMLMYEKHFCGRMG
ncbi:MAG: inorganic diphosphatase [Clostridiaceae bacterium]|jgi:inorganic pyrophosphatase|nr:inorganic diphosphatase [Clostridiaceae bacterium]